MMESARVSDWTPPARPFDFCLPMGWSFVFQPAHEGVAGLVIRSTISICGPQKHRPRGRVGTITRRLAGDNVRTRKYADGVESGHTALLLSCKLLLGIGPETG